MRPSQKNIGGPRIEASVLATDALSSWVIQLQKKKKKGKKKKKRKKLTSIEA